MNLAGWEEFQIHLKSQINIIYQNKLKTFKTLIKPKKIFLVGEISGNHLNDFATVKKIILKAKKSGFDAIKIQSFSAESMTFDIDKKNFLIKDGLWKNKTLWNLYTKSSMKISIQKKNI